jgi:ubiquinone/menaquinone biosynthesis C-methylase UbiE
LKDGDEPWRHQVLLYLHLLNCARNHACWPAFAEVDLLEVGCGRGGGISAMKRYYPFKRAVGIDLHPGHVAFCAARHRSVGVEFIQADALDLPFKPESFDLITNVESAHYYPDTQGFLCEVSRVLKRDGICEIIAIGLRPAYRADITARVRSACEIDSERFRNLFAGEKAEFLRRIFERKKREYSSGIVTYLLYVLQKV